MGQFFGPAEDRKLTIKQKIEGAIAPLSEEERRIISEKTEALRVLFEADEKPIPAKYKIEILFGRGRSIKTFFPGQLTVWKSGSALNGEGDELMFPCPDPTNICHGYIPPDLVGNGKAACPQCRKVWRQKDLKEHVLYVLSVQDWATVLTRAFLRLGSDCDLYIKTSMADIRDATLVEQLKDHGGERLTRARVSMIPVIYPMANIHKDMKHGADLYGRIMAFLKA